MGNISNHSLYNKNLKPYSRKLRNEMTKAEAVLWKYVLRAGNMRGYTFNRERPVLNYIADFLCKKLNLIIEVDGATHLEKDVAYRDKERENVLRSAGFKIIRFSDNEILNDLDRVSMSIEEEIEMIENENQNDFASKRVEGL